MAISLVSVSLAGATPPGENSIQAFTRAEEQKARNAKVVLENVRRTKMRQADVVFSKRKFGRDNKGTQVKNIHEFRIDLIAGTNVTEGPYDIAYYLNGRQIERYKESFLPFAFKQNFKGQQPGTYEVRIEVIDQNNQVLASQIQSIEVID